MKRIKNYLAFCSIFALLLAGCSKEETGEVPGDPASNATLSFGAILNQAERAQAAQKAHLADFPVCSEATPDHVRYVLSGPVNVGTLQNPAEVDISPNPGDYDDDGEDEFFTLESDDLELPEGTYTLEYFAVYDDEDNLIWVAPLAGEELANYVDNPISADGFFLSAGTKKYLDVDVLCYDKRIVNEYGYLFFELETFKALDFCIFGNYCDENGRHFVASYSVDVWVYEDGAKGEQLYNDVPNNVEIVDGEPTADPVCFALPDTSADDEYYFEITLLNGPGYTSDDAGTVIRQGVITEAEVRSFFDGDDNLDYYHFREGIEDCGDDNVPIFPDPTDEAMVYKSCLKSLNDSGVVAFVYAKLEGNKLTTNTYGFDTTPNQMHPQHIHGFADDSNATCPPESAADDDEDGDDRFISIPEGAPFYGPIQLTLNYADDSFPMSDANGKFEYERVFMLSGETRGLIDPLQRKAVVVHGRMVDGEYVATLPVACGQLERTN
ncbi:hypothetical protein [Christiangramia forsetii]|uniref:Membrane or secreted protein n=2 Tax=Christiangramia forsetii TaxID=411153 RepID=A0M333_CHRFK|nr:hypothetical protein [Christiangramia forsetii]GGG26892.1 hypothetical protein GCM10011532_07870 [Christiangramia forsetii]CAL67028.1 membrane or secreted protein [Christiangramia forsetii KT0803]